MSLIVPAPVEEPDRQKVIKEGKPRRTRKTKKISTEKTKQEPTSLLTEEQLASTAAKKQQLADLMARIDPLKQMLDATSLTVKGSKMTPFTLDISDNPVLMKIAKKIFKKKTTTIDLAAYLQLVEMIKIKQLEEIESYKSTTI